MISQSRRQQNSPAIVSTEEWDPKQPPTFNGKVKEDVYRWIGYMKNILTFMQVTLEQEVKYAATYFISCSGGHCMNMRVFFMHPIHL